jgi:DNA adenine methylase
MESMCLAPVTPVRPVAPWVGGKRNLARQLVGLIETIPHTTYAEPFVGMGGVFLRRTRRPRAEIVNDLSRDVSNFFRILQVHYVAFLDMLRFQITTRAEFERLSAVDPETLTDLQRAARFLYLQRTAFGGKVVGRNFGMDRSAGSFDVTKLGPLLEELHTRLAGVVIERLPFDRFIERYDASGTLIYADPPYWGSEGYYGEALFTRLDFVLLRDRLLACRGRWILSINDVPEVRELFSGCAIEPVGVSYGLAATGPSNARELIIQGRPR